MQNVLSCNIITTDLTDHLAIETTISLGTAQISRHVIDLNDDNHEITTRIFNDANDSKFKELIDNEDWTEVTHINDSNGKYEKFSEIYKGHYDVAYPLKTKRIRRTNERKNPKPWILPWLENACARKQLFYHEFIKNPSPENKSRYDKMNKFCDKHTGIAQKKYYRKYFENFKDDSKKQWQMINKLLDRKIKIRSAIKLHDDEGNLIDKPKDVASQFNKYFSSIASNLKENISPRTVFDPGGFTEFLGKPSLNSMYLQPAQSYEIAKIIDNFKNKATLDTRMNALKIANNCEKFVDVLCEMINCSFNDGIFPEALKIAKVVPIHKEGSRTEVSNYRPISLLSTFSKIYEKIMHNRVLQYFDKNSLLFEQQYGFRPGRSCEHALLNAQNLILNSLTKKEVSLLLLLDFSKAFDMVDHNILLRKLEHYGIRGKVLDWFKSYLSNRAQFVTIDGIDSGINRIKYGVPQGSILGPLLFIIYINDIPNICKNAKFILYADDANIVVSGTSVEEILKAAENLTKMLTKWVGFNGLALNLKKTKYIIFSRQHINVTQTLSIYNTKIDRVTEARFLGVIVDDKFTWSKHISTLKAKMARYMGVMYKIKKFLPVCARLKIFQSLIQSHLNFCSLVWGFASKSQIESLFRKQKSGIRAVMPGYVNYWYKEGTLPTHTKRSFRDFNILTVHNIIAKNALILMHKINHFPDTVPSSIRNCFPSSRPALASDHENCAEWLKVYNEIPYRASIFYKGPIIAISDFNHNLITNSLASLFSLNIYKNTAKKLLLSHQSEGNDSEWPVFLIFALTGLRQSSRIKSQNIEISYTEFF